MTDVLRSNMVESAERAADVGVTFTFTLITLADTVVMVLHRVWGNGAAVNVTQVVPATNELNGRAPNRPTSSVIAAV